MYFRYRLEESCKKLKIYTEENGNLLEEKKKLFERVQELNLNLTELRNENHKLKELKQKDKDEFLENIRIQKVKSDTLAQCFQVLFEFNSVFHYKYEIVKGKIFFK